MPEVFMPRLSDTMTEGVLSQWVMHEGDQVRKGDVLAVIETDKAAMEMEAYDEGVLIRILVQEGASVPIGTPIALVESGGGSAGAAARSPRPVPDHPERTVAPPSASAAPAPGQPASAPPAARPLASPLARRLARDRGIDLAALSGSGPGGRIVRADIEQAARLRVGAQPAPQPAADAEAEEIPLTTVRRITAQRLAASAREAPHFYLTVVAGADQLLDFRAQASDGGRRGARGHGADVKITVTDLLTRASAVALADCPEVNVSWDETRILRHRHVNIGIAVAIDDGLVVPVVRDADRKTLTEIARESRDLTARARARRLAPDELSGGTFTISNLGMYGIRQFTAVINPPQAAILAVGEAVRQPVVRDDQVTIGTTLTLTLSIDHRAVDGATAARFLTRLRELIEQPLDIVL
jgi:pyruvate dehydrogenase E2 component (dihydrolipoamide acetyltransferase)